MVTMTIQVPLASVTFGWIQFTESNGQRLGKKPQLHARCCTNRARAVGGSLENRNSAGMLWKPFLGFWQPVSW